MKFQRPKYAHLVAWGTVIGGLADTHDQLLRAVETEAPRSALFERYEHRVGLTGEWITFADLHSQTAIKQIEHLFEQWGWGDPHRWLDGSNVCSNSNSSASKPNNDRGNSPTQ